MSSSKVVSKKQHKQNLQDLYKGRDAEHEKAWLKGNRTSRDSDILAAGRQPTDKKAVQTN